MGYSQNRPFVKVDVTGEVDKRFDENLYQQNLSNDIVRFGKIDAGAEYNFPVPLGFDLFRSPSGKVVHTFNFKKYTDGITKVYIHYLNGWGKNNDGLSETTPVGTIAESLTIANGLPDTRINIVFMDKFVNRNTLVTNALLSGTTGYYFNLEKDITFTSIYAGGSVFLSGNYAETYDWSLYQDEVYSVPRSKAHYVVDYTNKDINGLPMVLKEVGTLAECVNERGTWYTANNIVYVHRIDGSAAQPNSDDLTVVLKYDGYFYFNTSTYSLYVENIHFYYPTLEDNRSAIGFYGSLDSEVILNNCGATMGGANGFALSKNGRNLLFNCTSWGNSDDGFNYHGVLGDSVREIVFEYDCYAYDNGFDGKTSSNASSAHDEIAVLRVNTVGHDCYGPLSADVNACHTVNIDCKMHDSKRTGSSTSSGKTAFFADSAASTLTAQMYLINCEGGGIDTKTVAVGTGSRADFYAKKLVGNSVPSDLVINILP